jgi:hypothetical protein
MERDVLLPRTSSASELNGLLAMLLGVAAMFTRQKLFAYAAILLQLSTFVCLPFRERDFKSALSTLSMSLMVD